MQAPFFLARYFVAIPVTPTLVVAGDPDRHGLFIIFDRQFGQGLALFGAGFDFAFVDFGSSLNAACKYDGFFGGWCAGHNDTPYDCCSNLSLAAHATQADCHNIQSRTGAREIETFNFRENPGALEQIRTVDLSITKAYSAAEGRCERVIGCRH